MQRRTFLAGLLLAAATATGALGLADHVQAQTKFGRWEMLGERKVNRVADRDTIVVGKGKGGFRQLRMNVFENSIHIERLTVVYGNGVPDDLPVRALIEAGGKTRIIDLRGGSREIRRIELVFRSIPNGKGRARIQVWARR